MKNRDTDCSWYPNPDNRVDEPFEPSAAFSLQDSIVDRFDAIARRHASRLAVQDTESSLTYGELKALVDRIAAATTAATQGRAGPVAILLAADAGLPAAMLGVLAAGRAYVALDPDFPGERNGSIVAEANACAVVSSENLLKAARAFFPRDIRVIDISDLRATEARLAARSR